MRHGRYRDRRLRDPFVAIAAFALNLFLLVFLAPAAEAACAGVVASDGARFWQAAAEPEKSVAITFLGHASFLVESPAGVRIVTDYNDVIRAPQTPDIVTMNNAHPMHYSEDVEPGVKYALRGWDPDGGVPHHQVEYRDVKVRNVPTNRRDGEGTRYNANSIFIFETADLCIAHLGHLHHTLTPAHLAALGAIDIVMVPVDGAYTLNQEDMITVLQQIGPKIAIPMHVFSPTTLERFLLRAAEHYRVRRMEEPRIMLSRADLPAAPDIVVLPGR